MSHGIVSPAAQSNFLNHSKSSIPIASSMLAESSSCLSFNPHLPKLSFSLKTQSGSLRRGPIKASAQSLSAATESFYDLLGIPQSVTPREIKQAYKHLVLKYHPDVSPPERIDENTKRFIRLQEAYETLSDPNTRALYDNHLATGSFIAFSSRKPSRYKEVHISCSCFPELCSLELRIDRLGCAHLLKFFINVGVTLLISIPGSG